MDLSIFSQLAGPAAPVINRRVNYDAMFLAMGLGDWTNPRTGARFDASDTAFLTRQIEHVRAKTYEIKTPSLDALQWVPLASDVPAWASHVVSVIYDDAGRARVISNSGDDVPRVDVTVKEEANRVVSLGAAYGWDLWAMQQALATGVPLSDLKARTCRRVIATGIDEIVATGQLTTTGQTFGMVGFVNASAVTIETMASAGQWDDEPADTVIADVTKLISKINQDTKQVFVATQVLMAPELYNHIAARPRSTTSDTTILEFLRRTNPGVSFDFWHRLSNAGASSKHRMIAYAKTPEVVEALVPVSFTQLAPQVRNFETLVLAYARCGGVRFNHPTAVRYGDIPHTG
jgi:hypothetical protein